MSWRLCWISIFESSPGRVWSGHCDGVDCYSKAPYWQGQNSAGRTPDVLLWHQIRAFSVESAGFWREGDQLALLFAVFTQLSSPDLKRDFGGHLSTSAFYNLPDQVSKASSPEREHPVRRRFQGRIWGRARCRRHLQTRLAVSRALIGVDINVIPITDSCEPSFHNTVRSLGGIHVRQNSSFQTSQRATGNRNTGAQRKRRCSVPIRPAVLRSFPGPPWTNQALHTGITQSLSGDNCGAGLCLGPSRYVLGWAVQPDGRGGEQVLSGFYSPSKTPQSAAPESRCRMSSPTPP